MNLSDPADTFVAIYNNRSLLAELYKQLANQSDILKYLYIKSIKLEDTDLFRELVTLAEKIDNKQVFRDILTMYGEDPFSLKYDHPAEEGLNNLAFFCTTIKSIKA